MKIITARVEKNYPHSEDVLIIQGPNGVYTFTGKEIEMILIEQEKMCSDCLDSGVNPFDEDDGEGHSMRGVGSKECDCKKL